MSADKLFSIIATIVAFAFVIFTTLIINGTEISVRAGNIIFISSMIIFALTLIVIRKVDND